MKRLFVVVGCLVLVAVGAGVIFAGFEYAAYEKTIADREVTAEGTVIETEVSQLPDGNWTYQFTYRYTFDQEAEIRAQNLAAHYPDEMADEQVYTSIEDGGKHDSESDARDAMADKFADNGSVIVYVDPYYPDDSSFSDATSIKPRALQYGGSLAVLIGILGIAGLARRVSA